MESTTYQWNLADLNPSLARIQIRGKEVGLELKTAKNRKFIAVTEKGGGVRGN